MTSLTMSSDNMIVSNPIEIMLIYQAAKTSRGELDRS